MSQIIIIKLLSDIIVFHQLVSSFYTFLHITIFCVVAKIKHLQSLHYLHYVFRLLLISWPDLKKIVYEISKNTRNNLKIHFTRRTLYLLANFRGFEQKERQRERERERERE